MNASLSAFADSIQKLSREELIRLLMEMEAAHRQDAAIIAEFRKTSTDLHREYSRMEMELKGARADLKDIEKKYAHVCEYNESLLKQLYGRRSEKLSGLGSAVPEACEDPLSETADPAETETVPSCPVKNRRMMDGPTGHQGRKTPGQKKRSLEKLPVVHAYELDIQKLDECYGAYNWRIYSWHTSSTVEKVPAVYYQKITHTAVISVGLEHQLVSIRPENRLYPYSLASPSVAASIIHNKFFLGLPLYRQEKDLAQMGFPLSRQTMSAWILHFAHEIFSLVYDRLCDEVRACPYNQCDETTVEVIHDGRKTGSKSYMWVHSTSELAECSPVVVFCYELTRGTEHLRNFYRDYTGIITSDAYQSYPLLESESNGRITSTGCMMHLRRRFAEALNLISLKDMPEETVNALPETKALKLIGEIYAADEPLKEASVKERTIRRDTEVRPLVDAFFTFVDSIDTDAPGNSEKLKDAVSYARNQEKFLRRFLEDGNIPLDNGNAERYMKPLAVGRRNWLFCNTIDGANASAILYSIVETAAACGAHVYYYLRYLLEEVPKYLNGTQLEFLEDMLPWSDAYRFYETAALSGPALFQTPFSQETPPRTPRKKDLLHKKQSA